MEGNSSSNISHQDQLKSVVVSARRRQGQAPDGSLLAPTTLGVVGVVRVYSYLMLTPTDVSDRCQRYIHESDAGMIHPAARTAIFSTRLKRVKASHTEFNRQNGRAEKSKREGMAENKEGKRAVEYRNSISLGYSFEYR